MPSTTYRRKLRTRHLRGLRHIVPPAIVIQIVSNQGVFTGETEFDKILKYFDYVIEMIIKQMNLTESISLLTQILNMDSIKTQVEFYKIMDIIETDLLSVVMNIADGINPGIIMSRIDFIRSFIDTLPNNPQRINELPFMILQLIDEIIRGANLSSITANITEIKAYIDEKYGVIDKFAAIQDMIISIIENIMNGANPGIIGLRVEMVKKMIAEL